MSTPKNEPNSTYINAAAMILAALIGAAALIYTNNNKTPASTPVTQPTPAIVAPPQTLRARLAALQPPVTQPTQTVVASPVIKPDPPTLKPPDQPTPVPQKSAADYAKEGEEALKAKKWPEMETAYRSAVRLEPSNADYNCQFGTALEWQGKYVESEPAHREAVRLNPQVSMYHCNLADDLSGQKKYSESERESREAIRLDPTNASAHAALGTALYTQNNYIDAEAQYREAIRFGTNDAASYANLAGCLVRSSLKTLVITFIGQIYAETGAEFSLCKARSCPQIERYAHDFADKNHLQYFSDYF